MVRVRGSGYRLRTAVEVHPGAWIKPGCGLSEATPHRLSPPRPQLLPNLRGLLRPGAPEVLSAVSAPRAVEIVRVPLQARGLGSRALDARTLRAA